MRGPDNTISAGKPGAAIRAAGRLSVYGLFAAQAARDPGAVALAWGRATRSYAALNDRVLRLASALRAKGVGYGDRVALMSENRCEYIEIELAAAFLGAIVACQNWRLAGPEIEHCVNLVTPALIVASRRFAPSLASLDLLGVPILVIEDDYERLIENAPAAPDAPDVDPEDGLVILYTSGTTGLPKGALISHRAALPI